jgi:catalase
MRDGQFGGIRDQGTGFPNYYPNSIEGAPRPDPAYAEPAWDLGEVTVDRWDSREEHDDYTQAGNLFRLMGKDEKTRLAVNIAESMGGCRDEIIERQLGHFDAADSDYGRVVREALDAYDRGELDLHESVQPHA